MFFDASNADVNDFSEAYGFVDLQGFIDMTIRCYAHGIQRS